MLPIEQIVPTDGMNAVLATKADIVEKMPVPRITYDVVCRDADGNIKWHENMPNVVCTPGINDLLDKYFAGSAYTAAWFFILKGAGAVNAADTLASHAGWTEVTPYTGNRPTVTWTAASAGSKVSNAIVVSITLAGPTTVAGAGLSSVNTGTAGILYSVADFAVSRSVVSGDTLTITATVGV